MPKPITQPSFVGDPLVCRGTDGKAVTIRHSTDGSVQVQAPAPPLREVTFSGGGGKGNVYPGVVQALQDRGKLAEAKTLHGASAGSITVSMLACGMTAEEFTDTTDHVNFKEKIAAGGGTWRLHLDSDGKEFETTIGGLMRASLTKRIADYWRGGSIADGAINAIEHRLDEGKGPTFGELRTLSKSIPAIKELVVDVTKNAGDLDKQMDSMVLNADNSPDVDVASAVHASSSIPPAFASPMLTTQDGETAYYRDGGILNNSPSSDTDPDRRDLDPIAGSRNLTMVFQNADNDAVAAGRYQPSQR